MSDQWSAAVLVVSDGVIQGARVDESGPAAERILRSQSFDVRTIDVVPDERQAISEKLQGYVAEGIHLAVTSGGTGFAPRDVTPEATHEVLEREALALAEYLRRETLKFTPYAVLSRGKAGIAGRTVIVNLPGSPKGVTQYLDLLAPLLPHAIKLASGEAADHGHQKED